MKPNRKRFFQRVSLLLATAKLLIAIFVLTPNSLAVQRQPRRTTPANRAAIDYSKFSHATQKHQATCVTCHKIPTSEWQKTSTYPDITDYPAHDACVSCHRAQFFKDARPAICSVCHTKTSPRDEARFVFRNPALQTQFRTEFPHDRHQDVIAQLNNRPSREQLTFVHALTRSWVSDDTTQTYYNCAICHGPGNVPAAPLAGWPDGFLPKPETFKAVPAKHDSCFNCHWKSQKPIAQDCGDCHKPIAVSSGKIPMRISLKFMHEGGGDKKNHVVECTSCHINITKSVTVQGLKPDVPITACTECHNKVGGREDVSKELLAVDKDKTFVCVYCHTSNIGGLDPPASHYLIAERPPLKRKEIK